MNPHELIGRSYVDMDDGFGELYCEPKVLAMKTEDGFVKRRKKERERLENLHFAQEMVSKANQD